MKSFILAAAFFGAIVSASANVNLVLDIAATDQHGKPVGSAQCGIVQSLSNADLSGTWTCSFNNGSLQTLKTIATYISDATPSEPSHLAYDVHSGEDLGEFLYKGLNLKGAHDFNSLVILLGPTPSTEFPSLMVGADEYSRYYYMNLSVHLAN